MVQECHHLPLLLRFGKPAEVFNWNFNSKAGRDDLYRLSLLFAKMGAQALMPVHNRLDRALQRVHIQSAAQPQRLRHVVFRAAALQLIDEP